jgi:hypothetical protein
MQRDTMTALRALKRVSKREAIAMFNMAALQQWAAPNKLSAGVLDDIKHYERR